MSILSIDFQATFLASDPISTFHVMPVDQSDVFLLRRIGCREAVACNLPFAADFFEDK